MPKVSSKSPAKPAASSVAARRTDLQPVYTCNMCTDQPTFAPSETKARKLHLEKRHNMCVVWKCRKCGCHKKDRRYHDMLQHVENVCQRRPCGSSDIFTLTVTMKEADRLCPPRVKPAESSEQHASESAVTRGSSSSSLQRSRDDRQREVTSRETRLQRSSRWAGETYRSPVTRSSRRAASPLSRLRSPPPRRRSPIRLLDRHSLSRGSSHRRERSPLRARQELQPRETRSTRETRQREQPLAAAAAVGIEVSQQPSASRHSPVRAPTPSASGSQRRKTSTPVRRPSTSSVTTSKVVGVLAKSPVVTLAKFTALGDLSSELELSFGTTTSSVKSGSGSGSSSRSSSGSSRTSSRSSIGGSQRSSSGSPAPADASSRPDLSPTSLGSLEERLGACSLGDLRRLRERHPLPRAEVSTQCDLAFYSIQDRPDGGCKVTGNQMELVLRGSVEKLDKDT